MGPCHLALPVSGASSKKAANLSQPEMQPGVSMRFDMI